MQKYEYTHEQPYTVQLWIFQNTENVSNMEH